MDYPLGVWTGMRTCSWDSSSGRVVQSLYFSSVHFIPETGLGSPESVLGSQESVLGIHFLDLESRLQSLSLEPGLGGWSSDFRVWSPRHGVESALGFCSPDFQTWFLESELGFW